jgi:CYTH domain-containing protein
LSVNTAERLPACGRRYPRNLPLEVERKFLVPRPPAWLAKCRVEEIEQGYLAIEGDEVEVRLRRRAESTYLTAKRGTGSQRTEVEVEVSAHQFEALWPLTAGRRLRKARYYVPTEAGEIEVDAYRGPLEGLVTAEIEFSPGQSPGSFERPNWIGEEVTGELGYANKNLATHGIPNVLGRGV